MPKSSSRPTARDAKPRRVAPRKPKITPDQLTGMIEVATVDADDESEQATGWFTMFEEHLELPFETEVLGVQVKVARIDMRADNRIVALCTRGKVRQAIDVADLPLPTPAPEGSEWIVAYARWLGSR
jgi:hypothetical protein